MIDPTASTPPICGLCAHLVSAHQSHCQALTYRGQLELPVFGVCNCAGPATPPFLPAETSELIVKKFGMKIPLTEESLEPAGKPPVEGVDYRRVEPTVAERAEYRAWRRAFKPLLELGLERGWWQDGGPDYGGELTPPRARYETIKKADES